jgi:hypothetical protein
METKKYPKYCFQKSEKNDADNFFNEKPEFTAL